MTLPGGVGNTEAAPLMGDLSGLNYTTGVTYDALGQVTSTTMPGVGGLPNEQSVVGHRLSGQAQTLTLKGVGADAGTVTSLVSAVAVNGTGQMVSRTYGNGVTRAVSYDPVTRQLSGLSASFPSGTEEAPQTTYVQADSFTRDAVGRLTQVASAVPNGGEGATATEVTGQCFRYDGFNRLASAWTVAGTGSVGACGTSAPASDAATGWDASATAYATQWTYSPSGKITSIVNNAVINGATTPVTATLTYGENGAPASGVTTMTGGATPNTYGYDGAGRQVTRTVDGVATALSWDVSSNLVATSGAGGDVLYVYDASGQRVAKIQVADAAKSITGAVTGYLGSTELTDANTAVNHTSASELVGADFITGTRYYAFSGATVAVRQVTAGAPAEAVDPSPGTSTLSLMFGDEQGSATVMMQVTLEASGAMAPASVTDPVSRNAYTPYGAVRGADQLSIDHGWLGQVSDEASTGLVYLNARYYDSGTSRFVSPDPLMNPADPKTLDAFMYAGDNPVSFNDRTGLLCRTNGVRGYDGSFLEEPCYSPGSSTDPQNLFAAAAKAIKAKPSVTTSGTGAGSGGNQSAGSDPGCQTQYCQLTGWPDVSMMMDGVWADGIGDSCMSLQCSGGYSGGTTVVFTSDQIAALYLIAAAATLVYGVLECSTVVGCAGTGAVATAEKDLIDGLTGDAAKSALGVAIKDEALNGGLGRLVAVASEDPAADALAGRIGGQARVKFSNGPDNEFDAVSDVYVAQAKPANLTLNMNWRNQAKVTFEVAIQSGRIPYFQFEGTPGPGVLDALARYADRFGVQPVIDLEPLGAG